MRPKTRRAGLGRLVTFIFLIDVALALTPPLYWAIDRDTTPILGVPAALFVFLAVSTFIAASVLFACWVEPADEEIRP